MLDNIRKEDWIEKELFCQFNSWREESNGFLNANEITQCKNTIAQTKQQSAIIDFFIIGIYLV